MRTKVTKRAVRWALALVAAAAAGSAGTLVRPAVAQVAPPQAFENPSATGLERGVTKPLHEPKLAFLKPGVIAKVNVKEGDTVKAGQVLAVQDDREEQAELASLEGDIKGAELQIEASQADLALKQVTLKRKREVHSEWVAAGKKNSEIEEAEAAVTIAEVAIKYRRQELISAKLKHAAAKVRVDQKHLVSPINGIVAKVDVRVGEGSDISRAAFQIVSNDTLYVEASNVPATKAKAMKVGQSLQVRYLDEERWMQGKLVFLSPYANASAGGARKIRMEMKNDGNREAGLPVYVRLPDAATPPPAAAAAR